MDCTAPDASYLEERRRRLAAERTLDRTRQELSRAHSALVANADRLSRRYLSEREQNLKLTERQKAVLAERREAADRADRARRRLWHALEAMRDGFAVFDGRGFLIAANHVYLDFFDAADELGPGAHATEIFGRAAEEGAFDIGDLTPEMWAESQVARWDGETIPPLVLQHYDGRTLRFQDRRAPDGDVVSLVVDISEHHDREATLAEARDAAERTARAKADFLARMSHEIRTPMNGILGMSQMLTDQTEDTEMALYARTIRDSAEALLVIVNDTLDVSEIEAGKTDLRCAPLDLEALLCDCLRLVTMGAGPGDVATALCYPLGVRTTFVGDEGRIRQIVMNLLGNALKFTDRGHVVLRVTVAEGDPARVVLAVEDTGPGIPEAEQAGIFDAFAQIDDPDRPAREGTGLGLTISRGLALAMGGTLTLTSRAGTGSTFTVTLPLAPHGAVPSLLPLPARITIPEGGGPRGDIPVERLAPAGVDVTREVSADDKIVLLPLSLGPVDQQTILNRIGTQTRLIVLGNRAEAAPGILARADAILGVPVAGADLSAALSRPLPPGLPRLVLADDNATNRLLLDRMLRDQPYEIEIVEDGAEAIAACRRHPPQAVVLDVSMPGVDGFEAAAAIREIEGKAIPLLAVTAHVGDRMGERLRAAGFVAHLTKPLRKAELLDALAAALSAQSSRTA